jgi:hypothetical protein
MRIWSFRATARKGFCKFLGKLVNFVRVLKGVFCSVGFCREHTVLVSAAEGERQKSKALFHAGLFSESPNAQETQHIWKS